MFTYLKLARIESNHLNFKYITQIIKKLKIFIFIFFFIWKIFLILFLLNNAEKSNTIAYKLTKLGANLYLGVTYWYFSMLHLVVLCFCVLLFLDL